MIEIKQGDIEAFRFASSSKVLLKEGRIAGYSIPSEKALLLSRVVDFVVIFLALLSYFKRAPSPQIVSILWVIQVIHAAIKISILWKPVRMNSSRPIEVLPPRMALQVEHTGFLTSLIFLSTLSLHDSSGYLDYLWMLITSICAVLLVYSGISRRNFERL